MDMNQYQNSNFRITQKGRKSKPSAHHNVETWSFVKSVFQAHKIVSWAQLSKACRNHDHPAGGDAFIPYLVRMNWIEQV